MIGATYHERGQPVRVVTRWRHKLRDSGPQVAFGVPARGTPRNVLIERASGERVVRPFRGLRKATAPHQGDARGADDA